MKPGLRVEVVGAGDRGGRAVAMAAPGGAGAGPRPCDGRPGAGPAQSRSSTATSGGVDTATDVLSFPADEPETLGDVVIARGVARRQARGAGHDFPTEVRVLALHGLLHLLGYDHEHDGGRMARLEARLRRKGGLREGLIERAEASPRAGSAGPPPGGRR